MKNMYSIFKEFTETQDIAVENYLLKRISFLFILFLLAIAFLFFTIEQEKPANQKFSFTALFQNKTPIALSPLQVEESLQIPKKQEIIPPAPVEIVKEEYELLPKGNKKGFGKILAPTIDHNDEVSIITIPYEGTIPNYQVTNFDNGSVHARVISLPGAWEQDTFAVRDQTSSIVRRVQMTKHPDEFRISLTAAGDVLRLEEEIRASDNELIITVRKKQ